jgi:hypothetical protein
MGFGLRTIPAPAGLLDLGEVVEIREVPYGRAREIMALPGPLSGPERLLAHALHIDGQPLTIARLMDELPGRYLAAVGEALRVLGELQGLKPADDEPAPAEGNQAQGPEGGNV